MSDQEKSSYVGIITDLIMAGFYIIFVQMKFKSGVINDENSFKYLAALILILIGVTIVLRIINTILFTIIFAIVTRDPDVSLIEDERDKLFIFKSERYSQIVIALGFISALVSIIAGAAPHMFLSIIFISFMLSEVAAGIIKINMYRRSA